MIYPRIHHRLLLGLAQILSRSRALRSQRLNLWRIPPVQEDHQEHGEIQQSVQHYHVHGQLVPFEECLALLHVNVEEAGPLHFDELDLLREPVELNQAAKPHEVVGHLLLEKD